MNRIDVIAIVLWMLIGLINLLFPERMVRMSEAITRVFPVPGFSFGDNVMGVRISGLVIVVIGLVLLLYGFMRHIGGI